MITRWIFALCMLAAAIEGWAQAFPSRPIRLYGRAWQMVDQDAQRSDTAQGIDGSETRRGHRRASFTQLVGSTRAASSDD